MAGANKHKRNVINRIPGMLLRLLNIAFMVALLMSCLARYISPDQYWLPAFFSLAFPVWFVVNLFFFFLWVFRWRRFAFVTLAVLIFALPMLARYVQWNGTNTKQQDSAITLITYNVKTFLTGEGKKKTSTLDNIKVFLLSQEPGIACLQEFRENWWDKKKAAMAIKTSAKLPYSAMAVYYPESRLRNASAIATFSKYPIVHQEYMVYSGRTFALITDLLVNTDTIRVFNVHLQSISFDGDDYRFIDEVAGQKIPSQASAGEDSRRIAWKLRKGFIRRAPQARRLAEAIRSSPYPVVVAGDFNDSPASYTYRTVKGKLKDAFVQSGRGIGNTYLGNLPKIRIDYVLLDPLFNCRQHQVLPYRYSDHYPVKAVFYLRKYH
jgi:endonuclease/exonuclease/phosphatase family metal-dependent hydrolase